MLGRLHAEMAHAPIIAVGHSQTTQEQGPLGLGFGDRSPISTGRPPPISLSELPVAISLVALTNACRLIGGNADHISAQPQRPTARSRSQPQTLLSSV